MKNSMPQFAYLGNQLAIFKEIDMLVEMYRERGEYPTDIFIFYSLRTHIEGLKVYKGMRINYFRRPLADTMNPIILIEKVDIE